MYERKKVDIRNTFQAWICSDTMKTLVWEFTKVGHIWEKRRKSLGERSLKVKYFQMSSRSP